MSFEFQKFTDPESSYDAKVSIRQTGQFGFNAGAANKFKLAEYPYVVLYYDVKRKAIGIELLYDPAPSALELNRNPSNIYIRSKSFCDRYGVEYDKARRFPLRRDETTGFLYFELDEGQEATDVPSDEIKV